MTAAAKTATTAAAAAASRSTSHRITPSLITSLKSQSLQTASQFPDYNFRNYFLRITKEDFAVLERMREGEDDNREALEESMREGIYTHHFASPEALYQKLQDRFEMMQRQVIIHKMYSSKSSFMDDPEREFETVSPASKKSVDEMHEKEDEKEESV